jgi:hypothetical protein
MRSVPTDLCPMTGWMTARLPGRNVMVEVEYVHSIEELRHGSPRVVQLAMTIERATGLVEGIQRAIATMPGRHIIAVGRSPGAN